MRDGLLRFSAALTESTTATLRGLEAAKAENARGLGGGNVRRVMLTSSSRAVCTPTPGKAMKVGMETWNPEAVTAMRDPVTPGGHARDAGGTRPARRWRSRRGWGVDAGARGGGGVRAQTPSCRRRAWAPCWRCGRSRILSVAGFVRQLFEGTDLAVFQWLQPRWFDVRDAAALHVAALVLEGLEGERVLGWAEPYTWTGVVKVKEKLYPGRAIAQLEDKGGFERAAEGEGRGALRRLEGRGWIGFEESVRANVKSFYPE